MPAARPAPEARRVLIVTYEYPPLGGGGGVIFRDLAEELARSLDVTVLTTRGPGLAAREQQGRLEIVRVPVLMRNSESTASLPSMMSFFPSSLSAGARLLREKRFDLIHTSFAVPSGPSGLLLARLFGLPHVLSLHGGDIYDPSKALSPHRTPGLKQTVRRVIHGSDRVVAQSSDTRGRARSIYGEREIDTIPLAVRPPPFDPVPRSALGLGDEEFVLTTVGRLIPRKGLGELIEIVAALGDPRFRLVVIGDGPERENLETRARELGVADAVHFAGFVPEVKKWQLLSASDLYVSTSLHEGFGIVFLEAMACGLPVLCYDRGGQVDFVSNAVGRLLPLGDAGRFGGEILALASDPEQRTQLASAARRLAAEYSIQRYAERYRDIYAECLVQHGASEEIAR
ncbi:MAG: glycosyltransferase family 4 protein [Deltaproteobacteria bacterium]|nr:glycosyltransferase family 4 protein [Deltaproteobacteria bacterium]MBW2361420.1 glycosyltransferase family 4 protein [Deltaproteobacteria bacterium]